VLTRTTRRLGRVRTLTDLAALRVVECWGDVPDGEVTDFRRSVQANADETVVYAWIEWPGKATRGAACATMREWMEHPERADPRMDSQKNPVPFDGKRLIYGGFAPLVQLGASANAGPGSRA